MSLLRWGVLVVVTLFVFGCLAVSGLWGVALAAPVLVIAPFEVRRAVRERRARRMFDAELDAWLGRTGGRG